MPCRIERSEEADRDFENILDFLVESYLSLGESRTPAVDQAARRLRQIEDAMASIRDFPHRAVSQADLLPGVRSLTRGGAIFYFDIGEAENLVRVLAVFLAGQDHRRSMLVRLARRHRG